MNNSNLFKDRIKMLIDERHDGSVPKFANAIGTSHAAVYKWLRGEAEPNSNLIRKIFSISKVSIEWLITGEGEMLPKVPDTIYKSDRQEPTSNLCENYCLIPLYDIQASAGNGSYIEHEQIKCHLAFRKDWITDNGLQAKDLAALTVKGDSMGPTLQDKDLVLIDQAKKTITADAIYVLVDNSGLKIKRVQRLLTGDVIIKSDNPHYDNETLTKAQQTQHPLTIAGQVVWYARQI